MNAYLKVNRLIMNIIPEEPEIYLEVPRPTPSLQSLLGNKGFYLYVQANTSQLLGSPRVAFGKKAGNLESKRRIIEKKIQNPSGNHKKQFIYLGIGFGILAITKLVKNLSSLS